MVNKNSRAASAIRSDANFVIHSSAGFFYAGSTDKQLRPCPLACHGNCHDVHARRVAADFQVYRIAASINSGALFVDEFAEHVCDTQDRLI